MRDLSMHIMDICQNSVVAHGTVINITIHEDIAHNKFSFVIEDNGKGMSKDFLETVKNPFTTSRKTRDVGLGIPLLNQTCINCGGSLDIESKQNVGTKIIATMQYDNIDRPPLGDISNSIFLIIIMNESVNFVYKHIKGNNIYELDTRQIKHILEVRTLAEPDIHNWLKQNIKEGICDLC